MSDLKSLISRLYNGIAQNHSYIQSIRYPKLLIQSLEELDGLIGNQSVKDSVASQVIHLISIKTRAQKDSSVKEDRVMLHTLLYGDPGTGKTSIGKVLAKVWYSLGYIDGSQKQHIATAAEEKMDDAMAEMEALKEVFGGLDASTEKIANIFLGLLVCYWVVLILGKVIECGNSVGFKWSVLLAVVLFFLFLMVVYLDEEEENVPGHEISDQVQNAEHTTEEALPDVDDLITVVSRTDFVDRYSGWTDKKTLKLLNDNLGKVLFVDEAYSLVSGSFDTFGIEVVNTITQFLSEHPGEIVIIFAGYKNLIQRNLFSVQPGLCRRFMWQFECPGYDYSELFEIFTHQLLRDGWSLRDTRAVKRLFRRNKDLFPNYGGDTEKLTFFAKLEHSRDEIHNTLCEDVGDIYFGGICSVTNELTTNHVRKGLRNLRKNNIKKERSSVEGVRDLMANLPFDM